MHVLRRYGSRAGRGPQVMPVLRRDGSRTARRARRSPAGRRRGPPYDPDREPIGCAGDAVSGTRVLVAGASIAGPALAHWMRRRGAEVTVVERAPELRPGGQAVDARGVTKEGIRRM